MNSPRLFSFSLIVEAVHCLCNEFPCHFFILIWRRSCIQKPDQLYPSYVVDPIQDVTLRNPCFSQTIMAATAHQHYQHYSYILAIVSLSDQITFCAIFAARLSNFQLTGHYDRLIGSIHSSPPGHVSDAKYPHCIFHVYFTCCQQSVITAIL